MSLPFKAILFIFLTVGWTSCKNEGAQKTNDVSSGSITATASPQPEQPIDITLKLDGAEGLQMNFDKLYFDNSAEGLQHSNFDENGKAEIQMTTHPGIGLYRVRFGAKSLAIVLDGTEKDVVISSSLPDLDQLKVDVQGNDASDKLYKTINKIKTKQIGQDEVITIVKNEPNKLLASILALQTIPMDEAHMPIHLANAQALREQQNIADYAGAYQSVISAAQSAIARQNAAPIRVGAPAPEIALPNPDGNVMKLSDLKGKVVLIDFWASWCKPCRLENPNVVRIYNKYKDRGFTVFSVSLDGVNPKMAARMQGQQLAAAEDGAKERWVKAIAQDKLTWKTHVSDLKFWKSIAAQTYGVQSIPQTFLLDREGNIVALNPRNNLEETLLKHL